MEFVIGVILGFLLGFTGAGGSVFAVPLMMLLLGMSVNEAMGTALGAVAISALYGMATRYRDIAWRQGLMLSAAGVVMAPLGRWLSFRVDERWLLTGFCLLAAFISVVMWRQAGAVSGFRIIRVFGPSPRMFQPHSLCCELGLPQKPAGPPGQRWQITLGGLVIGLLSGLFGVGGGIFIVPFLNCIIRLPLDAAIATSIFVIAVVSSVGYGSHIALFQQSDPVLLIKIVGAGIVGLMAGQRMGASISKANQQRAIAALLTLVCSVAIFERL